MPALRLFKAALSFAVLGVALLAQGAVAGAPDTSLRPQARSNVAAVLAGLLPDVPQYAVAVQGAPITAFSALPPLVSLRPVARQLPQSRAVVPAPEPVASRRRDARRGTVCGDRDIRGEVVGLVPGRLPACGIKDAVKVTEVSGVRLSTPALMNCRTAKAFRRWVDRGLIRSVNNYRGGVTEMQIAGHYVCRTRNHQPGAKISEHGKGNAIDISGFTFADGSRITLLNDWGRGEPGRILRRMHRRACGPFGTVLGPEADRFHRDHFHFDTARHSYCR